MSDVRASGGLDHLVETDGKLVVPKGWSPEHGPREDGAAHDQQIVWDLFTKQEASAKRHPLQQVGDPDDVAQLAAFLLTAAAKFFTGQVLRPDGGLASVRMF